jgi:predicted phage gp36 major capsid-like protein
MTVKMMKKELKMKTKKSGSKADLTAAITSARNDNKNYQDQLLFAAQIDEYRATCTRGGGADASNPLDYTNEQVFTQWFTRAKEPAVYEAKAAGKVVGFAITNVIAKTDWA